MLHPRSVMYSSSVQCKILLVKHKEEFRYVLGRTFVSTNLYTELD